MKKMKKMNLNFAMIILIIDYLQNLYYIYLRKHKILFNDK